MVVTEGRTDTTPHDPPPYLSKAFRFFIGCAAGMTATALVHPLDLLKCRMQLDPQTHNTRSMARQVICCEGFNGLYNGLSAGLLRQATYTTTRLAVFAWLYDNHKKSHEQNKPIVRDKVKYGILAGLAGAMAGNPSEVALVRMMGANAPLPRLYRYCPYYGCEVCYEECPRKPYKNVFDALKRIVVEEGPLALWRGGMLTLGRSLFVSAIQIGTYARVREALFRRKIGKDYSLHLYSSLISSFLTTAMSLPIDLVKTRYQMKSFGVTQANIFREILNQKGALYFWKGFIPYFVRMFIHSIVTYTILNELSFLYYGDLEEEAEMKRNARPWWKKLLNKS